MNIDFITNHGSFGETNQKSFTVITDSMGIAITTLNHNNDLYISPLSLTELYNISKYGKNSASIVGSQSVIEFQNDEIERIQREVARQLGYELVDHRLELYGSRLPQENEDSG